MVKKQLDLKPSSERYNRLKNFLKEAKERVEGLPSSLNLASGGGNKSDSHYNFVTGATTLSASQPLDRSKSASGDWKPCVARNVDGATDLTILQHPMESCNVWNSLSLEEKQVKVKCIKHLFKDHTTDECTVRGRMCKYCSQYGHHFLLCPLHTSLASSHSTTLTVQSSTNVASPSSNSVYSNTR